MAETHPQDFVFCAKLPQVTSSPVSSRELPPELRRLVGGSVAEVSAFARGFTHIGCICRFGAGRLAFRLVGAFPPDCYPIPLDSPFPPLRATSIQGAIPTLKAEAQHLSFTAIHLPTKDGEFFLRYSYNIHALSLESLLTFFFAY